MAINSALKTDEYLPGYSSLEADESHWIDWDFEGDFYRFIANYFEIRDDRVLAFKKHLLARLFPLLLLRQGRVPGRIHHALDQDPAHV